MNTLKSNYQAVINDVAADIEALKRSGKPSDMAALKLLQKRLEWLVCRKNRLTEESDRDISELKNRVDGYVVLCETFWKDWHGRTYEKKMDDLLEVKRRVVKIYSLTGFDACYALLLTLKPLRGILPLRHYEEYAPAISAFEKIKNGCITQLGTYIKV